MGIDSTYEIGDDISNLGLEPGIGMGEVHRGKRKDPRYKEFVH